MNSAQRNRRSDGRMAICMAMLLLATFIPVLVTSLTSAAQLSARSISLSSSSASATNVIYEIHFTTTGAAGAFVVNFCSNSPIVGEACVPASGFSLASATTPTAGFTRTVLDSNTIVLNGSLAAESAVTVAIHGVTNPSAAGPLYARIITYGTPEHANAYTVTDIGEGSVDQGGAAVSITSTVGVGGSVLETMTFCVSGGVIEANCANTTVPVLKLGGVAGNSSVLSADEVSTAALYTQISTNAVNGAVVRLKSSAIGCGGLLRAGAPTACDILPALDGGIQAGSAKFGVKTAIATGSGGVDATGTYQPVAGSGYNSIAYALNYVAGNATGVTSIYGDPLLDTANAPAVNQNMQLTFGASIGNDTPAGSYSADISFIATGKF